MILRRVIAAGLILTVLAGLWYFNVSKGFSPEYVLGRYSYSTFATNLVAIYLGLLGIYVVVGYNWRERVKKATLAFVSVSCVLLVLEIPAIVGFVDYRDYLTPKMVGFVGPRNMVAVKGYHRRPPYDCFSENLRGEQAIKNGLHTQRYRAVYIYDKRGFRNEVAFDKVDIVLIGDSFAEGYRVTQSSIVAAELAGALQTTVYNLGITGFGPQHELAVLRDIGIKLKPSVVVWCFYEGNDLWDLDQPPREYPRGPTKRMLSRIILATVSRQIDSIWPSPRAKRVPSVSYRGDTMLFDVPKEPKVSQIERFKGIIHRAGKLCDGIGAEFLVVFVPDKFRVYRDLVSIPKDSVVSKWPVNDLPQRIGQLLHHGGIEYLDLTEPLQNAAQENLVYYVDDVHWSPQGHHVAAEAIAQWSEGHSQ